jgi:hypothetical protein
MGVDESAGRQWLPTDEKRNRVKLQNEQQNGEHSTLTPNETRFVLASHCEPIILAIHYVALFSSVVFKMITYLSLYFAALCRKENDLFPSEAMMREVEVHQHFLRFKLNFVINSSSTHESTSVDEIFPMNI